jgi:glycosyltransferase involved in cell wall biosynthesis
LLIGDGPLKSEVEQLIKEENIYKKTTLTGLRRDVASYLSVMDIFMITSLWEGLPRVIPQAMAMEVPVVAYRADGTIEAIEDGKTGFLSPPGDLHKMVELCQLLIAHADKRRIMGQNGRAYASKEFDLTDMIISISSLYESLLSTKRNNH